MHPSLHNLVRRSTIGSSVRYDSFLKCRSFCRPTAHVCMLCIHRSPRRTATKLSISGLGGSICIMTLQVLPLSHMTYPSLLLYSSCDVCTEQRSHIGRKLRTQLLRVLQTAGAGDRRYAGITHTAIATAPGTLTDVCQSYCNGAHASSRMCVVRLRTARQPGMELGKLPEVFRKGRRVCHLRSPHPRCPFL